MIEGDNEITMIFRKLKKMQEEQRMKNEKKPVLKSATERYQECADVQWNNYLEAIECAATQWGSEHCYLLSDSLYPIRDEHLKKLLEMGYDIEIKEKWEKYDRGGNCFMERKCYYVKCFFMANASGKLIYR